MHQEKLEMKTKVSSFITANICHIKIQMEENVGAGEGNKRKRENFATVSLISRAMIMQLAVGAGGLALAVLLTSCVTLAKTLPTSGPSVPPRFWSSHHLNKHIQPIHPPTGTCLA